MIDANSLELMNREELIKMVNSMAQGGVIINFFGKRVATEILPNAFVPALLGV